MTRNERFIKVQNDYDDEPGREEEGRKALYRYRHKDKKAVDLAREQHQVQDLKDWLESLLKLVNAEFDTLRLELLPLQMEDEGLEGFRVEGVGRVSLTADMYVKVKPNLAKALILWLKKNKLGDLAQETVNSSTLKAFVKRRIEEGLAYPEDVLSVTPFTRASITKS